MKSIIAYVLIIVIAAAAGIVHGQQILAAAPKPVAQQDENKSDSNSQTAKSSHDTAGKGASEGHGGKGIQASINIRELKPIVTNLAEPRNAWARLEVAIVLDRPFTPDDESLVAEISNDIIAYLRTISAHYIEGATGLQRLREDLKERAQTRSDGKIRDILLETLVVQ